MAVWSSVSIMSVSGVVVERNAFQPEQQGVPVDAGGDFRGDPRERQQLPQQRPTDLLNDLAGKFDIYQHSFELTFQTQLQHAHFNYPALLLAGQNLLANALRYAQQQIRVEFSQQLIDNQQFYQLTVSDDGPGMAEHPDVLQRLFRRGDNSSGFGLGLYIVSKVASWHQGEVCIHSTPGHGTAVSLRWPVAAQVQQVDA